jgi:hypothetical protein
MTGLLGTGRPAARAIGVTEQSCYRWRKEFGGLKLDQAKVMSVKVVYDGGAIPG